MRYFGASCVVYPGSELYNILEALEARLTHIPFFTTVSLNRPEIHHKSTQSTSSRVPELIVESMVAALALGKHSSAT